MRNLSGGEVSKAGFNTVLHTYHPVKPTLEAGWGAVIDGKLLKYQLQYAFRHGLVRPNTPLSWNYNENESWGLHTGFFPYRSKVPELFPSQIGAVKAAMEEVGSTVPSDFSDQYLKAVYSGDGLDAILDVFSCPNENGKRVDCSEPFASFLTTSTWSCPLRMTLEEMKKVFFYLINFDINLIFLVKFG